MQSINLTVRDVVAMEQLGEQLAQYLRAPAVICLEGDLGAGKTTLVRSILRAKGWGSTVKSPTYTLVETYAIDCIDYHHFDLYRLSDPEELEFLGIRDYFSGSSVSFIEWPERGLGTIPAADIDISIAYCGDSRTVSLSGQAIEVLREIRESVAGVAS